MRATGTAFRTPIAVAAKGANRGDGSSYGTPREALGNVKGSRRVTRGPQGETVTSPMVLELPHDDPVAAGDRVTVGRDTGTVTVTQIVYGAFGVPHHLEVTAT